MPTYEYKCTDCSLLFDFFQSMKDEKLKECPKCGGNLKRLISAGSAPIFKGSGFYQTDYKNSSKELKKEPIEKVKTTEKTSESNTKTKSSSIDK